MMHLDVLLRSFDTPDEVRHVEYGRFDIVNFRGQPYGRATYGPGWQWSRHGRIGRSIPAARERARLGQR